MAKKKTKKGKTPVKKEENKVCETFEVNKDGGGKLVKTCGVEPKKHASKKEIAEQNKLLRNIILILGFLFLVVVGTYLIVNNMKYVDYEGIEFDAVKSGNIVFYHTVFKIYDERGIHKLNYNVYLRNSPIKLGKTVVFDGSLDMKEMMVLDSTEDFKCEGDGIISVANMVQVLGAFGTTVAKDPNATCDDQGRYMYILIQEGDETKIEQFGPACYNLYVNNCEILEVTERFILEALNEKLN